MSTCKPIYFDRDLLFKKYILSILKHCLLTVHFSSYTLNSKQLKVLITHVLKNKSTLWNKRK